PHQPTVLGFEVENPSELHKGKEHDQPLMLIHKGMATMDASALRLNKAVKQGQEKIDIVGEAWHSHQGTSWEMGVFPKREPDLPTRSSRNAFVHTPHIVEELGDRFGLFLLPYLCQVAEERPPPNPHHVADIRRRFPGVEVQNPGVFELLGVCPRAATGAPTGF